MQMPKLARINLNTGVGKGAVIDRKQMIGALFTLEFISGQKPCITRAKKTIDKFKLREKMMIGCKVTLRKKKMYFFLDRLINIVLSDQGSSDYISFRRPQANIGLLKWPANQRSTQTQAESGKPSVASKDATAQDSAPVVVWPRASNTTSFQPPCLSRGVGPARNRAKVGCAFGIQNVQGAFKELPYGHFDVSYGMDIQLELASTMQGGNGRRGSQSYIRLCTAGTDMTDSFQMPIRAGAVAGKE